MPKFMRIHILNPGFLAKPFDQKSERRRIHWPIIFWSQTSKQAMERRLSLLRYNGYLDWLSSEQRRTKPVPEPVVWLAWQGVRYIAGQSGVFIKPPANSGENQLCLLDRRLREQGVRWLREPRWSQLAHDLVVVDFRVAVDAAVTMLPSMDMETWIPEGDFLSQMDVVDFTYTGKDGKTRKGRKGVRPDGYFVILDHERQAKGSPSRARFLLELDNSTHPHERFGRDKVAAGLAYIKSPAFKARFGYNAGWWSVMGNGGCII
jgi:hypothetical protein